MSLLASLALCQGSIAEQRMVEFRDGSRLPLELADLAFSYRPASDPGSAPQSLPLAEAAGIEFAPVPPFERSREVLELIRQLGADDFANRERAVARLRQIAGGFESMLREALERAADADLSWRILTVLKYLAPADGGEFDVIDTRDGTLRGEVAPWKASARYRGTRLVLDRRSVRAIRRIDPSAAAVVAERFKAYTEPPADGGGGHYVLDFEKDGQGSRLSSGQSVEAAYRRLGVRFDTSYQGSFVGVVKYVVEGGSGDQTAATIDPLFHGVVSAHFHQPGEPEVLAGVNYVSCRLAVVERGGTSLVAYDALGGEIGRATVESGPHAFLAVASTVPIAKVSIVPDPALDADYTFDDFTISRPQALVDAPHPKRFTMLLSDGARVQCESFENRPGTGAESEFLTMPSEGFPSPLRIPARDVASIMPPTAKRDSKPVPDNAIWALLADGSSVIVHRDDNGLSVAGTPVEKLPLLALWGQGVPLQEPRAPLDIPNGGVAMLLRADPEYLSDASFEEDLIVGRREDGSRVRMHYKRLPTIWFREPPEVDPREGSAALLLVDGSLYQTGAKGAFQLGGIGREGLEISLRSNPGKRMRIPWARIATLDLNARE